MEVTRSAQLAATRGRDADPPGRPAPRLRLPLPFPLPWPAARPSRISARPATVLWRRAMACPSPRSFVFFAVWSLACSAPPASPPAATPTTAVATVAPPSAASDTRPAPAPAAKLALGAKHACGLLPAGEVRCWGDNVHGQLADGTQTTRASATPTKIPAGAVALATGEDFTCALDGAGAVRCWGAETPAHSDEVLPDEDVDALLRATCARGDRQACRTREAQRKLRALMASMERGAAKLPAGTLQKDPSPRARPKPGDTWPGLTGIREIAAGGAGLCAREASGRVLCLPLASPGSGGSIFVLADTHHGAAVAVPGLEDAAAIAVGSAQACALRATGEVVCWSSRKAPEPVPGVANARALVMAESRACALLASREVACWKVDSTSSKPEPVEGVTDAVALAAGGDSTCALRADGEVVCWGALVARGGQPGAPTVIPEVRGAAGIALGRDFACAAMPGGAVRCWGATSRGRLGGGAMPEVLAPREVEGLRDVVEVQAFGDATCARRADGTVTCWGGEFVARAGDKPFALIGELREIASLTARDGEVCALERGGRLLCAHRAAFAPVEGVTDAVAAGTSSGSLCIARRSGEVRCGAPRHPLFPVPGVSGVTSLAVSTGWMCGRSRAGAVVCWEQPASSFLDPNAPPAFRKAKVPTFGDAVDLATTGTSTCVARKTGGVECFAYTLRGPSAPEPQPRITDAIAVTASDRLLCVRRSGGRVACDGRQNVWGERGDGPLGLRGPLHTEVVGLPSATHVDAGARHVCAVAEGKVLCWGDDTLGQVSGRPFGDRRPPAAVRGL